MLTGNKKAAWCGVTGCIPPFLNFYLEQVLQTTNAMTCFSMKSRSSNSKKLYLQHRWMFADDFNLSSIQTLSSKGKTWLIFCLMWPPWWVGRDYTECEEVKICVYFSHPTLGVNHRRHQNCPGGTFIKFWWLSYHLKRPFVAAVTCCKAKRLLGSSIYRGLQLSWLSDGKKCYDMLN